MPENPRRRLPREMNEMARAGAVNCLIDGGGIMEINGDMAVQRGEGRDARARQGDDLNARRQQRPHHMRPEKARRAGDKAARHAESSRKEGSAASRLEMTEGAAGQRIAISGSSKRNPRSWPGSKCGLIW